MSTSSSSPSPSPSHRPREVSRDIVPGLQGVGERYVVYFAGGALRTTPTRLSRGDLANLVAECLAGLTPWEEDAIEVAEIDSTLRGIVDELAPVDGIDPDTWLPAMARELIAGAHPGLTEMASGLEVAMELSDVSEPFVVRSLIRDGNPIRAGWSYWNIPPTLKALGRGDALAEVARVMFECLEHRGATLTCMSARLDALRCDPLAGGVRTTRLWQAAESRRFIATVLTAMAAIELGATDIVDISETSIGLLPCGDGWVERQLARFLTRGADGAEPGWRRFFSFAYDANERLSKLHCT
jgi:hypothetical protein